MNQKIIFVSLTFFIIGGLGVFRSSADVRTIDLVRLFSSGFVCGVALTALIVTLWGKPQK